MKKAKPQGGIVRWLVYFLFVATVLCTGIGSVWAFPLPAKIDIDPTCTYLNTWADEGHNALAIRLSDYEISPGDTILLETFGYFLMYPGDLGMNTNMGAVFSSSNILDPFQPWVSNVNRIPGAIDAGEDWETIADYIGWFFDIPEDFRVDPSVTIQVPTDAKYLFVAAVDSEFYDNSVPYGGSFGVQIGKVPEPATMLLLGFGLLGLWGFRKKFKK